MKYFFKISLLLLIGTMLYSCKKGAEDPGVSFRTRKARLIGNWIGTNYSAEINSSVANVNGQTVSSKETINSGETDISIKTVSATKTITATGTVNFHTLEITKDGEYFYALQYNTVANYTDTTQGVTKNITIKSTKTVNKQGKWAFTGKLDGSKNKENVLLSLNSIKENTTTETITVISGVPPSSVTNSNDKENIYQTGELAEIWQIVQLKNKIIKLEMQIKNSNSGKNSTTTAIGSTTIDLPLVSSEGTVNLSFKQ